MRRQLRFCAMVSVLGAVVVGSAGGTPRAEVREGGVFRVSTQGLDYIDPALSYSFAGWALLDTTCARLMAYPDKPPPEGLRLQPEVAAAFPKVSRDAKTHTFTLRSGFRFSDGTPVRASAFARAINRTLAPGVSPLRCQYTRDIAGATDVQAGGLGRPRASWRRKPPHRAVHAPDPRLRRADDDALLLRRAAHAPGRSRGRPRVPGSRSILRLRVPARRTGRASA